jgi:putative peptidoglycan lipid II flippase
MPIKPSFVFTKGIMSDSSKSIFQSAKRFFSGTLLSRISGMIRDVSMAYAFGTDAVIASFMVAYRLAHLCRRLFGEGSLQSAFIPEFESLRYSDSARAFQFFRDLAFSLTIFLILLISFFSLGIEFFLVWGNLSSETTEILKLTLLMLPSLLFICLFGLNASLLQCEKIYFTSAVAPVAFNCAWIATIWILKTYQISNAIYWLAISVIIACFLQWLVTIPQTLKILKQYLFTPTWQEIRQSFFSPDLKKLIKPFSLGMIGVMASQINAAVDTLFAQYAEPEGPAFLWYAIRLQQLPLALFGVALAGALLPPLTRALKDKNWERYEQFLQEAISYTFRLMIPLTAAIFVMGYSSVNLIFGHGDFVSNSVIGTTKCLWGYGIGLLPSCLILLLAPACYAQHNYQLPAIASLFNMVLNLCLNSLFIMGLGWGATSVAIATSLSAWVNVIFLTVFLNRQKTWLPYSLFFDGLKILGVCGLVLVGAEISKYFFEHPTIQHILIVDSLNIIPFNEQNLFIEQGLEFFIQLTIFTFLWILSCQFFRLPLLYQSSSKAVF